MFLRPSFGLAEVAWRWTFGLAACALAAFSLAEYFDTLPVTRADLFLLKSRQPVLFARALEDIFHGSGAALVETSIVLALCLSMAWIVVAGLGRAATIKALLGHFRSMNNTPAPLTERPWSLRSLFGLNFFRVAVSLAAMVACWSPFSAAGSTSTRETTPGVTLLIFLGATTMIGGAWSVLNWFLSLAALFVVAEGEDTFGAIGRAVDFFRNRFGPVSAVGTWFGLAHLGAFTIATFLGLFSMGLLGLLPRAVAFAGVLCVTLIYFAIADFLYIGRLAAYVAILELPEMPVEEPGRRHPLGGDPHAAISGTLSDSIDQSELILSDVPSQA
jgi:hypothetical protein